MYSPYKNKYGILQLAETTIRNGLRENEEKQRRGNILGFNTSITYFYISRNITRKLPVSFFSFLPHNWRTGGQNRSCLGGMVPVGREKRCRKGIGG
jgi:hypothetical protein